MQMREISRGHDKQLADNFENYYISYAINRKTVKHPFTYQDDFLLEYEILRQKLLMQRQS